MKLKEIRQLLGHNGVECKVVIHRNGTISRFGNPNTTNRDMDYWHDVGTVKDVLRSIQTNNIK